MNFITVFSTVISGVLVYIIGQILNQFFIEKIIKQRETFGKISDALIMYANLYTDPIESNTQISRKEERNEAQQIFRNLACELLSRSYQIPVYKVISGFKITPKKKNIMEAHHNLIGLSNSVFTRDSWIEHNLRRKKEIEESLKLIS